LPFSTKNKPWIYKYITTLYCIIFDDKSKMSFMLVKDIMTKDPIKIDFQKTVLDACRIYKKQKVGCLIITKDDECIGIVTERDIIERTICDNKNPNTIQISEIMSSDIKTVHPLDNLEKAIEIMKENNIRKLPVIKDKNLIGIITVTDISKARPDLSDRFIETWVKPRWED